MLTITILGCGPSLGVPIIGCKCAVCKSEISYNKRSRSAIFITDNTQQILIDFGPDIRNQLLKANINKLDLAILTHAHNDHLAGMDDLRVFPFNQKHTLNIVTDQSTAAFVENQYKYLFKQNVMRMNAIDFFDKITLCNHSIIKFSEHQKKHEIQINTQTLDIQFFKQNHGIMNSLGIRIGNFVYSTDVIDFPEESYKFLYNIKTWILDCGSYISNNVHAGLDKVLQWNKLFKPQQILLTNMNHEIDYHQITQHLPSNISPLYDGYELNIN